MPQLQLIEGQSHRTLDSMFCRDGGRHHAGTNQMLKDPLTGCWAMADNRFGVNLTYAILVLLFTYSSINYKNVNKKFIYHRIKYMKYYNYISKKNNDFYINLINEYPFSTAVIFAIMAFMALVALVLNG